MERYKNENGKVAVLISPEYGAGWSTWSDNELAERLIFDPTLVQMVLDGRHKEINEEFINELFNLSEDDYVYCGGVSDLRVEWLDEGENFYIDEYDGYESIVTTSNLTFTA